MNYNAQKEQISTAGILPLLEPVPIFYREEVSWGPPWGESSASLIVNN